MVQACYCPLFATALYYGVKYGGTDKPEAGKFSFFGLATRCKIVILRGPKGR
jgi:hypothetical protein